MTTDDQPPVDDAPEPDREALLTEQLSRQYDFLPLSELEREDPERAQEHRDAAHNLAKWIAECPREERRAAFRRGYDRGRERAKEATAEYVTELEAALAELRQDRDPEALRARIADLEYVLRGYLRHTKGDAGEPSELLARLTVAQRELAELKGAQPSDATGLRPSV